MRTKFLPVDPAHPAPGILAEAGAVLRQGGLVAFPTETVYGLGANALDSAAVGRIFAAKGRPSDNPLIVHVADRESLTGLVSEVPAVGQALIEEFWPGPLTLVLPKTGRVPDEVTAGLPTVAVRMPDHDVALGLIAAAGVPVAAPSANRSGRPSPTTAAHVWEDLAGRVEIILDGGPAGVGVESTVVDVTGQAPMVLRPGGLSLEELRRVAGEVGLDPALSGRNTDRPRAPGMKYTHYAPQAPLTLVAPGPGAGPGEVGRTAWAAVRALRSAAAGSPARPAGAPAAARRVDRVGLARPVGLLALSENLPLHRQAAAAAGLRLVEIGLQIGFPNGAAGEVVLLEAGPAASPEQVAVRLFAALRRFDEARVAAIVAEGISEERLGFAVMNRLRKAATHTLEAQ